MGIEIFKKHLREKRAVKINIGAENTNLENVAKACRSAQFAKASALSVACDKKVIETAKKNAKLPIFATSIHPFEILEATKNNVDAIEIGNYEQIYKKGKKLSLDETYDIILETFGLINDYDVFKCVTIPSCLSLDEQIKLVKKLEFFDIDLIQTEGLKQINQKRQILFIKDVQTSILNTAELYKNTRFPIMTSGKINETNAKQAFQIGASAISIDSAINLSNSETEMKMIISKIVSTISYRNSINREIIRSQIEMLRN